MTEDHRPESVPDKDELIAIARLVKARGLRGEVVADLLTDFPERFEGLKSVVGLASDGTRRSLQIEEQWFHGDRLVLKFAGFDDVDAARGLVGLDIAIPVEERVELPPDSFYEWQLAGCRVETIGGSYVGEVNEVMRTGGVELLAVLDSAGRERLIPMASDICVDIDVEKRLIRIDPPEGLLEL